MKYIKKSLCLLSLPLILSACNTVEGFAKDLQAGGTKLEETVKDSKDDKASTTAPAKKN